MTESLGTASGQLITAEGMIVCALSQGKSKLTQQQFGAPTEDGKRVCRFLGAQSTRAWTERVGSASLAVRSGIGMQRAKRAPVGARDWGS